MSNIEILIEIGTDEQQRQIKQEIELIIGAAQYMNLEFPVTAVHVPKDIDLKISEIEKVPANHQREVEVAGKIVAIDGKYEIIFSPKLYTADYDSHIRYLIYLHELAHVLNRNYFPVLFRDKRSSFGTYFTLLYTLADELFAESLALELQQKIVFEYHRQQYSKRCTKHFEERFLGFINLLNDKDGLDKIQQSINSYRFHGDVDFLLSQVNPIISDILVSFSHAFSFARFVDDYTKTMQINNVRIANKQLLSIFNSMYEAFCHFNHDLLFLLNEIEQYFANFGFVYKDDPKGIWVDVHDCTFISDSSCLQ